MKRLLGIAATTGFLLAGCTSAPSRPVEGERVLSRMDGLEKRPDWVTESVSVKEKDERVLFIGVAEVPSDSRVQAAFKASDLAAKGFLANKIETQLTKVVESSDAGLRMDDQSLKSLITEVSRASFRNLDVTDRYWEQVAKTAADGTETRLMKVFSLLSIPKAEMKQLLLASTQKAKAPTDLRNKVEATLREGWTNEGME